MTGLGQFEDWRDETDPHERAAATESAGAAIEFPLPKPSPQAMDVARRRLADA